MVPESMFSSERASQPSITDWRVEWPLRFAFSYFQLVAQMKNSRRSASAINPVTKKNKDNLHSPTNSKVEVAITLRFQLCSTQNNRRSSSQSIQFPGKIHIYKHREAFVLLGIDTLSCQQKEMGHKKDRGKSMIRVYYVLWYAKRHLSG